MYNYVGNRNEIMLRSKNTIRCNTIQMTCIYKTVLGVKNNVHNKMHRQSG